MAGKKSASKPSTASKTTDIRPAAVHAALHLAARDGWNAVTLQAVAAEAGVDMATLHDHFDDRLDLLAAYGKILDRQVLDRAGQADSSTPPRDRLFDLIMERFDALNDNRAGILAILDAMKFEPKNIILAMPHLARSMSWMLEAAGISTGGWQGSARIVGLTMVYLATLRQWAGDGSEDMAPTMAALDKNLGRAEHWAGTLRLD